MKSLVLLGCLLTCSFAVGEVCSELHSSEKENSLHPAVAIALREKTFFKIKHRRFHSDRKTLAPESQSARRSSASSNGPRVSPPEAPKVLDWYPFPFEIANPRGEYEPNSFIFLHAKGLRLEINNVVIELSYALGELTYRYNRFMSYVDSLGKMVANLSPLKYSYLEDPRLRSLLFQKLQSAQFERLRGMQFASRSAYFYFPDSYGHFGYIEIRVMAKHITVREEDDAVVFEVGFANQSHRLKISKSGDASQVEHHFEVYWPNKNPEFMPYREGKHLIQNPQYQYENRPDDVRLYSIATFYRALYSRYAGAEVQYFLSKYLEHLPARDLFQPVD